MFMCVAVNLNGIDTFSSRSTNAVGPFISVPGMADILPSVSATPVLFTCWQRSGNKPKVVELFV